MLSLNQLSGFGARPIPRGGGADGYFAGASVARVYGTSGSVSLTSLTGGFDTEARAGDLVVVAMTTSHNGVAPSYTCTATGLTFTKVADTTIDSTVDIDTEVYYCQLTATPPPSITVATNGTYPFSAVAYVIRGHNTSTPLDAATTSTSAAGTTGANPPSITTVTANALVLAIGCFSPAPSDVGLAVFVSYPSGYTEGQFAISGIDVDIEEGMAFAYRIVPAPAVENPGIFVFSGGATGSVFSGITMAIRTV